MGNIRDLGRAIFRDFETDGVPSSGPREPRKRDIRDLFDVIDAAVTAFAELQSIGPIDVIKPGLSALNSDLAHGNGTLAAVISTNEAAAGIYEKSGASGAGSWTLRMLFATVTSAEVTAIVNDLADLADDVEAFAGVAAQVDGRDDDGVPVTDANGVVSLEVEPSGALAAPAILARQVSGVRAGYLRRQHLSAAAHLPLVLANLVFGQSNALANKATPPLSTRRSGRNMRTFNAGVRAYEGPGTPSENRASLIPHVETENLVEDRGETSCFGSAEAFCDLVETEQGWEDYANTVMVISAASGEGSTTIAQLLEEEVLDRFLLDVQAAADFAQSEFGVKVKIPALFWNQGEGNVNAGTPPADWKNEKIAAQATVETAINAITGQSDTIPFIFPQIATWNYYGKTRALAIAAAELAAANDKFLLLPSYMLTFPDGVHYTAADHHGIVGPRVGMLMKRLAINAQARSAFAPTRPISNDREGKFARFAYKTWGDDDLTVDTRLVRKAVNLGIEMFQSDGTTAVTIDRVWVHPREIIVKCATNPAAGMKYRYACAGSGNGRVAGPRGNIRSTFGDQVQVSTMQGVKPVHDWAAACEYTLT